MNPPRDKIICMGRFPRRVVACMHNCPYHEGFCGVFWQFFRDRGETPIVYWNQDGIGEKAMRRVVYDCDRCDKRDISKVHALTDDSSGEALPLEDEARRDLVRARGWVSPLVAEASFHMLVLLERERGWTHFCTKCFQQVCDGVGKALGEKRPATPKKTTVKANIKVVQSDAA